VNNKWFDENCRKDKAAFKSARNEYLHTKTPESRSNFTKARTKYNKTKRVARQKYRLNEDKRLECIAKQHPRKIWKTVKNSYKKVDDKPDSLSINELCTHFKDLFGKQTQMLTMTILTLVMILTSIVILQLTKYVRQSTHRIIIKFQEQIAY